MMSLHVQDHPIIFKIFFVEFHIIMHYVLILDQQNEFIMISAAWVHRGFSDDVTEKAVLQPGHELISDFQKDKFRHFFFHVLDHNADCVISLEDFEKLNEVIIYN